MRDRSRSWALGLGAVALAWLALGCGPGTDALRPETSGDPGSSGGTAGPASAIPTFSDSEAALVALLRSDARVECAPMTADLPAKATAAVGCLLDTELVKRIDVFAFRSQNEAALAYLRTLRAADVRPRSGNCETGKGGDGAWAPGDDPRDVNAENGVRFDGAFYVPDRYGCFVEAGIAHAIATCGKHFIEIVGTAKALAPLHTWVWDDAGNTDPEDPVPPGICTGT